MTTNSDTIDNKDHRQIESGINPVSALILIIIIAIVMVLVSFIIFLKSGAYDTVKQIKAGTNAAANSDLSNYDTTSPIKADELKDYSESLNQKLNTLDDEADFGQSGLSNQNLGL